MLAVRLPKELEERLEYMAKKTGRTKSLFAREAIIENIEALEDYYLLKTALAESDGTTVTWSEAMKELELDN
ncbi:MAG: RelB/StbD replicon stabilization protein (antitoxin to RelE/StbE) [Hyphomonadaceae bacterium]|nr:MAG: RelB/StbD replicon stabilization protein (antitoxin to RelE/StbE) [Hyphomonadaceae bacterium]KAF0183903.1 MAG: RelB/StbD replicon stabilization protein (antitoxin to RelE/StbE) [Hyphomonadaceae bacterium]